MYINYSTIFEIFKVKSNHEYAFGLVHRTFDKEINLPDIASVCYAPSNVFA